MGTVGEVAWGTAAQSAGMKRDEAAAAAAADVVGLEWDEG